MVKVTYPKSPAPSLPQDANYLVLLFQQPHLWNTRHQQFLKARVLYDAPAGMIVGLANLPRNGDEEFESLATQFTLPSKEDLSTFQWRDPIFESNPFTRVFEHLGEMIEMADLTEPATDVESKNRSKYRAHNNKYYRLSRHSVRDFIDAVWPSIYMSIQFHAPSEDIKFHVPSCKVKGTLRCEGSISRRSDTEAKITLPLATFAAIHPHKPKSCITNEIPHILVQAIIAFQRNPDLNKFRGHMIRQEGAYFEISSALVSRAYVQSVQLGHVPTEDISLFRSGPYDLREQKGRREALRTLIGMMRYLDEVWFDG